MFNPLGNLCLTMIYNYNNDNSLYKRCKTLRVELVSNRGILFRSLQQSVVCFGISYFSGDVTSSVLAPNSKARTRPRYDHYLMWIHSVRSPAAAASAERTHLTGLIRCTLLIQNFTIEPPLACCVWWFA